MSWQFLPDCSPQAVKAFMDELQKSKTASEGTKHDAGKPMAATIGDFGLALTAVAEVGTFGAAKYGRKNWLSVENANERYSDALWRHLLKISTEGLDPESQLKHKAHAAWNALADLELELREELK
jgi:hypothetical protein